MSEQPIAVVYTLDCRFLGQRYLLVDHDNGPGYACIPVTD